MSTISEVTIAAKNLLKDACSPDQKVSALATMEMAKAFETPIQQAVLSGSITGNIFSVVPGTPGKSVEYPTDLVTQSTLKNHLAYSIPDTGAVPDRFVNSDYVRIPTFPVGNSISCSMRYLETGNFDIVKRMMEVLNFGFVQKMNDDAFRLLISAALGRGVKVSDPAAAQGFLTKRLVSSFKTAMSRLGGGNSTSQGLRKLTDLMMSPEAHDDMISWDLTQVDDQTRREIYINPEGQTSIFGVKLNPIYEFGVGQTYQKYYTDVLGGTLSANKEEILLGLSLNRQDSFVMVNESPVEIFEDLTYHRKREVSFYGWARYGLGVLDVRPVLLGEI